MLTSDAIRAEIIVQAKLEERKAIVKWLRVYGEDLYKDTCRDSVVAGAALVEAACDIEKEYHLD